VAGQRRAGDIISTTASIEDIRDKGTGETIFVRLSSENQQGELVEETLFTLFVRGRSTGETKPGKQPTASTHSASEPLATIAQRLDEDQTYRYSDASGDRVNIHLDPEVARQAGFRGIIGRGHGACHPGSWLRTSPGALPVHLRKALRKLAASPYPTSCAICSMVRREFLK
jgi:acyl dehydratase